MSQAPRPLPSQDDLDAIREGVRAVCAPYDDEYWLDRDDSGEFPKDFHRAMADGGWLGIAMPEEYSGTGLGVTEAMTMMNEVAACGESGRAHVCTSVPNAHLAGRLLRENDNNVPMLNPQH